MTQRPVIQQYPRIRDAAQRRLTLLQKRLPTYVLGVCQEQPVIVCLCCGQSSVHPTDITERFCGYCGAFHKEPQ